MRAKCGTLHRENLTIPRQRGREPRTANNWRFEWCDQLTIMDVSANYKLRHAHGTGWMAARMNFEFAHVSTHGEPRLVKLARRGVGRCTIAPPVLHITLAGFPATRMFAEFLVGPKPCDDVTVCRINAPPAVIATTVCLTSIVDNPMAFGAIAAMDSTRIDDAI